MCYRSGVTADLPFFATSPKGIEPLLADELRALGAADVQQSRAGVGFRGSLELAYRVCLWSRLAVRVLLPLASFPAATPDELYAGVRSIDWSAHLDIDDTLAVDFAATHSAVSHTHYGALKVKDAIVDQFRERSGLRPSVAVRRPSVRVNVHVAGDEATVSIDLSGESLHRRGYREEGVQVEAPLKENLAAAILIKAGWGDSARPPLAPLRRTPKKAAGPAQAALPTDARAGRGRVTALVDPFCGSGTLLVEGAWIAGDVAPGLLRTHFGFLGWKRHDPEVWERLLVEARERRAAALARPSFPVIVGYDHDPRAVKLALANIERAGLRGLVHVERRELAALAPPAGHEEPPGLVVANPPYGERIGEVAELSGLYGLLGEKLRTGFRGWKAAVFTGNPELGKTMGLRARKMNTLYDGALACKLLQFDVDEPWFVGRHGDDRKGPAGAQPVPSRAGGRRTMSTMNPSSQQPAPSQSAEQFVNRLRKNLRTVAKRLRRDGVTCYRVYDADLPDYALAVDVYERRVVVQEYAAPAEIAPEKAAQRLAEALRLIPSVLEVAPADVFLKVRRRQRGASQYEKQAAAGDFREVHEGDLRFLVNFTDYLDTGLFLDQRMTRGLIRDLARGRRFLNLFAYTGSATVAAAAGGAVSTTSVDLSQTYLDWARRNLELNGFATRRRDVERHGFVRADVLDWIGADRERYDLILLDPPTFSNSKRMKNVTFEVQRDHADLIRMVARRLHHGGVLLFATNYRRFKLEFDALRAFAIDDLSKATLPPDCARSARMHHVFKMTWRG